MQTISAQTSPDGLKGRKGGIAKMRRMDSILAVTDTTFFAAQHPGYQFLGAEVAACKSRLFLYGRPAGYANAAASKVHKASASTIPYPAASPFITIHGSLMYEGFYQSNMDTPYLGRDLYQHTVQLGLDVAVKNRYPLKVYYTTKFSNAPFLKGFTDLGLQFNNTGFKNGIYGNLEKWGRQKLAQNDTLFRLDSLLAADRKQLDSLRGWLSNPAVLQRLVEEREKAWLAGKATRYVKRDSSSANNDSLPDGMAGRLKGWGKGQRRFGPDDVYSLLKGRAKPKPGTLKDSLPEDRLHGADSTAKSWQAAYASKRKSLDSLQKLADSLQKVYTAFKNKTGGVTDSIVNRIEHIKDPHELAGALGTLHLPDSVLPAGYKKLLALRSFGLGRSTINYSELSVKNISIEGVQAEYNPSWYLAVAAGSFNYRFRDFVVNETAPQRQYLAAIRLGTGTKEGSHFFVTYYTGRKQVYNYGTDSAGNPQPASPGHDLMGITLEKRWQLTKTTYVIGEAAKSSLPYYNGQPPKQSLLAGTVSFRDRSNEAYSFKMGTVVALTQTKIEATYRELGANFQSFSLFTTSSAQQAWSVRAEQPFFKRQLVVGASIKKNEFTNPYINQAFYSNVVFKSISATLRRKKWPVVSLGYFPSSQLVSLGSNQFKENLFYTLVGTASHSYKYMGILMNTILSYTRFYNKSADSGFVYYNTSNVLLGQGVYLKRFTLQGNLSLAENGYYSLYAADGNVQWRMCKWLTVGGGLKCTRQTTAAAMDAGYSANAAIRIPGLGEIQFLAQKTYIPGMNMQLVKNNIGRLMYYKTF